MEHNEAQRITDNRLLEMIQRHFPSLPLDDRYTDWPRWLKFANAVRSEGFSQVAEELESHASHWEAWYLRQRADGVMPKFDEKAVPSNALAQADAACGVSPGATGSAALAGERIHDGNA